ncbi:AtpZ/AtpI family protein [Bacillus sp. 1NLA3E]|uniref:AtpZ/AtpI family protein n=1 Tax=Bacillus sp. 1NLA3E TaxID=666686 RepID=UPI000247E7C0|nr:AtpZ/AtpI family protein [Bacillus sp. 1NLA3E]AGK52214.1 hypothetical protein B1NLA3E_02150 [Bacillus sp. 1NLA3E]
MSKTFIKTLGQITEQIDLVIEEKWIYAYYSRSGKEKTAYILKNESKTTEEYLYSFLENNHVSEDLKSDIKKYLNSKSSKKEDNLQKFSIFLIKALSYNVVIGIIMGLSIFGGYKLGAIADTRFDIYPLFTIIGVLLGLVLGGLVSYVMIMKYLHQSEDGEQKVSPGFFSEKKQKSQATEVVTNDPFVQVSLDEVRNAIRNFSEHLPKGTFRTILVNDDFTIDFSQLVPYLPGIPSQKFYMSKETYDVFDESEKEIPEIMDKVQKAVDHYFKDHKQYPTLSYDPLHRVNFFELIQGKYLDFNPELEFYITDYDGIISHIKPNKSNNHID